MFPLSKEWMNDILQAIPSGLLIFDYSGELVFQNEIAIQLLGEYQNKISELYHHFFLDEVIHEGKILLGHLVELNHKTYFLNAAPIIRGHEIIGALAIFEESLMYRSIIEELEYHRIAIQDLQTIFDNSYDVIYVSDGDGITLRASSACERLWGKKPEELIGRSVYDLENEGVYRPSATRLALERKQKVQIVQETRTGRRLMVVSTPIRNSSGEIVRVVNASRDITEIHELETELQQLKDIVEGYKIELARLQDVSHQKSGNLIYRSSSMEKIILTVDRIASVDSTVLITGESGTGKEVITDYIHSHSPRANRPLIKVNCAAIPETLLESELFGYEQGSFTGAQKNGRAGLFELANDGTIFLDEIGDMPINLQSKLLRILQDKQIMRIGGRKPITINVRIIAATNQDLINHVEKGKFRQDLYYRLNVIPIQLPPLRERREDIVPLIQEFLMRYAQKFGRQVRMSEDALNTLVEYRWPGNVRELQNIIERLTVTTDSQLIGIEHIPEFLLNSFSKTARPIVSVESASTDIAVHRIIPLKKAVHLVEVQLLQLAHDQHHTITEMAKALEMDQSSISRKIQKYALQFNL